MSQKLKRRQQEQQEVAAKSGLDSLIDKEIKKI